jgi:phosphoribosylformylglycinamidine synthase subunit PurS
MYKAQISVSLRRSILDPQGKATHHALSQLGFDGIQNVRIGKLIELKIEAPSEADAIAAARKACEQLLANPVTEDFEIEIVEMEPVDAASAPGPEDATDKANAGADKSVEPANING